MKAYEIRSDYPEFLQKAFIVRSIINHNKRNIMKDVKKKTEHFRRIATNRVEGLIKGFEKLGKCSNKEYYAFTDEEVDAMFEALAVKLAKTKLVFSDNPKKEFSFD